jgi:hypothetical protein
MTGVGLNHARSLDQKFAKLMTTIVQVCAGTVCVLKPLLLVVEILGDHVILFQCLPGIFTR